MLDATEIGTVAQSLDGLRESARSVRDQLSGDTWMVLGATDRAVAELVRQRRATAGWCWRRPRPRCCPACSRCPGWPARTWSAIPGWYFMDIGRRLERAQQVTALLRATLTRSHSSAVDSLVVESVLAASESGVTYRRRYRAGSRWPPCSNCCCWTPATRGRWPTRWRRPGRTCGRCPTRPEPRGRSGDWRTSEGTLRRARPEDLDRIDDDGAPAGTARAARRAARIAPRDRRCHCRATLLAPQPDAAAGCRHLRRGDLDDPPLPHRAPHGLPLLRRGVDLVRARLPAIRGTCPGSGACSTS